MVALIQYPIGDIPDEGIDVDVALPPGWLDRVLADADVSSRAPGGETDEQAQQDPSARAGRLRGRLSTSGVDVVVRARVVVAVQAPCAR